MIVSIGQLIIAAIAAIALPIVGGSGTASVITVIVAELFGVLLGVNQFFDFIKKGSVLKTLCWIGAIADLIVHFVVVFPEQGASIALFSAFIGFPIGWMLVAFIYNMIEKTGETVEDIKDFAKDLHNPFVNEEKKSMYYCRQCKHVFSGDMGKTSNCPYCSIPAIETTKTLHDWKELSSLEQTFLKGDFANGQYLKEADEKEPAEVPVQQRGKQTVKRHEKDDDIPLKQTQFEKVFCRKCGAQIPADSAFCPKCGEKVIEM